MVKLLVMGTLYSVEREKCYIKQSEYKKLWWQKVFKFHKSYPFAHS